MRRHILDHRTDRAQCLVCYLRGDEREKFSRQQCPGPLVAPDKDTAPTRAYAIIVSAIESGSGEGGIAT